MDVINTSKCLECRYGILNDSNKARVKVYCIEKDKHYYYGQCVPCENFTKKENLDEDN